MRTSILTEREISGIKIITQGQTQLAQVKKAITQSTVAKKREEVRVDLREAGDRARDRPSGYAEAPNFHLHGNSDDDQSDTVSESESNCSEQWYELDGQEQEALISPRDARKKLQHAAKSRRFHPKRYVVPSVTGKKTAHSLPEAARRDPPLQRAKEKVVGSGEKNLMARGEEVHRTTRLWRSTKMVRKLKRHI